MIGATKKQNDLLSYITEHFHSTGIYPSYDEMKDALGLKSKSGIHRMIIGLEERGLLRRIPGCARALEIVNPAHLSVTVSPIIWHQLAAHASRNHLTVEAMLDQFVREGLGLQ